MTLISLKTELFLDYDFGPLLGVEDSSTFPSDFSLHLDVDICLYTCTEKICFCLWYILHVTCLTRATCTCHYTL